MHIRAVVLTLCFWSGSAFAIGQASYVSGARVRGGFPIANERGVAWIYVDRTDWPGVARAAADLQEDIARVTDRRPELHRNIAELEGANVILVGTIGKSAVIDGLIR